MLMDHIIVTFHMLQCMHVCRAQAVVADWKRFVGRILNVCGHRQMARLSRLGADSGKRFAFGTQTLMEACISYSAIMIQMRIENLPNTTCRKCILENAVFLFLPLQLHSLAVDIVSHDGRHHPAGRLLN